MNFFISIIKLKNDTEGEGLTIIISILNNNFVLTLTKTYSMSLKQKINFTRLIAVGRTINHFISW